MATSIIKSTSRRQFLKASTLATGGLFISFNLFSKGSSGNIKATDDPDLINFNSYLSIHPDGSVTIYSPNPEVGQGIKTSFPMIVAEELDMDWSKIKVEQAPLDTKRFERQVAGGSRSTPHSWKRLREAGATARNLLMQAAAAQWSVPMDQLSTTQGFVWHKATNRSMHYGSLAVTASKLTPSKDIVLKDPSQFHTIGTWVKSVDNMEVFTGKAIYGFDVKRPGMLHAMIVRPPAFGMTLKNVDSAEAKAMPGILEVVTFGNKVAVVGKSTWEVIKIVEAEFVCPFVPHNSMEPMNFFADVKENTAELVGPTQTPESARNGVAKLLNIPQENITVEMTKMGGGFGRRLNSDYALEAAELSSLVKAPIKLLWTREDDMTAGIYRPACKYKFKAALDANGNITAFHVRGAGMNSGNPVRENNFPVGAIDHVTMESSDFKSAITTGPWRAPITNFLAGAEQIFFDEVAEAAGKDPLKMRLELVEKAKTNPVGKVQYEPDRFKAVIDLVAEKSNWYKKKKGVYKGFSVYFAHSTYVAQVAEVIKVKGIPVVKKVYCAVDCGILVNQSGARNQVVGSIVDGIGTAMFGKLSFNEGAPDQSNFDSYRLIRMSEIPAVDVHFVKNTIEPTGLGEPALPPISGAVGNALYSATGIRYRDQPFIDQQVSVKSTSKSIM
ncbi:MAG: xanthine dehydrogenase family protein molybdopterin-binding subunit [Saprospiraceae bacterium]|nr:xanthine dehydrogenase family protein molybdopterin-binding subunit [Saprospiraceae bacterium]